MEVTVKHCAAMLFVLATGLRAWTAPDVANVCNSAPPPGGRVEFNVDCAQPADPGPTAAVLFYSTDGQITWQQVDLTRVGAPGYDSTYAAELSAPVSGAGNYYVRASNGANWSTQSPFNSSDQWPPAPGLLAAAADEPAGDADDPEGPWMDLTGAFIGRSATHFYAALTNNHTSWPTYTFPQPWYIYSLGFVNPEAQSDTWAFALSYANIPAVYTTGLYAINRYANSFERVADAEAVTDGNRLSLRCPIASFTGDARFGPWPNPQGFLTAAANAQAIYPIGGSRMRDTTAGCWFWGLHSPGFTVGANSPPVLSNPRVVPVTGTPETDFWFNTRYTDPDTNLPRLRVLVVDGETIPVRPNHHRYGAGVLFDHTRRGFAPGTHYFSFAFNDGVSAVASSRDSFEVIGTGIADAVPAPAPRLAAKPNPFTATVSFTVKGATTDPLVVSDATGRIVSRTDRVRDQSFIVDLGFLPPGVYFARTAASRPLRLVKID